MRSLVGLGFSVLLAGLVGCTAAVGGYTGDESQDQNPDQDSGASTDPDHDAGSDPTDSSTPGTDSGTTPDSGSPATDTGSPATDSGTKDTGTGDTGSPSTDTGTGKPDSDPPVMGVPVATGVSISQVAVLQGVEIPVAKNGSKVSDHNDIVAGRAALVRVFVTPKSGWSAHAITGELKLVSSSGTLTYSASLTPSAASADGTLGSTMNFDVPTDAIKVDTAYSVTLYDSKASSGGDTSGAHYPASGTESLGARSTGSTLKIVIVPIQYNADGSGRLPDTTAAQLEAYRAEFYAMYPARSVTVTVRAPYAYSGSISASGSGFSNALTAMQKLRQSDGVSKDTYYYGAFAADTSFDSYCGGGCVTGLCGLSSSASDATVRACVGIGFTGSQSAETAAHEVGHAHGRQHSPCGGAADPDPSYPYSGASIGAYGYDLAKKVLYSPSKYTDLMGYCDTIWISDYTYQALLDRMAFVGGGGSYEIHPFAAPQTYRYVQVAGDGSLTWGETITLDEPPQGEPRTVTWENADGSPAGTVTGSFYSFDHLAGGYMLVPEAPKHISAVRFGDTRLLTNVSGY